ncbi:MAG: hypothetical protein R3F61_20410 [Myxococcota bacterium]
MLFCSFPTLMVRGVMELLLVAFAILYVSKRHPAAGMLLAAAGLMAALGSFGGPALECAGYTAASQSTNNSEPYFMAAMLTSWFLWLFGPLTQALNLMLILFALALLARELPERERE